MYENIKILLQNLFLQFYDLRETINEIQLEQFNHILKKEATQQELEHSVLLLSQLLHEKYKEKVILLIDEYDVPIQKGYLNGFYNDIVGFIKNLFNNALKTNDNIKFAIMTGVLRVSKESIFSDLNNVDIYTTIDTPYDEYFGFTDKETKQLLKEYKLELTPEVKKMYNGYIFGNQEIYNPWSILNYASRKQLLPYWINTSGNELLQQIFDKTQEETKGMLEDLILGKSITCKYNEKVTFLDLNLIENEDAKETVANFLLVSGYLTKTKESDLVKQNGYLTLKVPNNEVKTFIMDVYAIAFKGKKCKVL